jgi:hypothetical protein
MRNLKTILQILALTGILCSGATAVAANKCLDQSIVDDFHQDFKIEGDAELNVCDPKNVVYQTIKAVQFIKGFKGAGKTTGPFALNVLKVGPFEYFKKRVNTIVITDLDENCTEIVSAYAQIENPGRMHICKKVFSEQELIVQGATLIHEARHFDGFQHVNCIRGDFKYVVNNAACDESFQESGSYAVEVAFYHRLLQDSSVSPALRNSARSALSHSLVVRFNKLPADLKDGAFLTDTNKIISFFDGKSNQPILQLSNNQRLTTLGFYIGILTKNSPELEYLNYGLKSESVAKNNAFGKVLEIANGQTYLTMMFQNGLIILSNKGGSNKTIKFSQIQPQSVFTHQADDGQLDIIMTDKSGRYTILPRRIEDALNLRESQLEMIPNKAGILKMQTWQGERKDIVLTTDGQLSFLDRSSQGYYRPIVQDSEHSDIVAPTYSPIMRGSKYLDIMAPVVWSKSLQDL